MSEHLPQTLSSLRARPKGVSTREADHLGGGSHDSWARLLPRRRLNTRGESLLLLELLRCGVTHS